MFCLSVASSSEPRRIFYQYILNVRWNVTYINGTFTLYYTSNIPYVSDALNSYTHLIQGENKLITQYLTRAKVLLEHIHHNSKMCDIPGISYDKLYLVPELHSPHVRRRVASEQDTWHSIEDVFQTIEHVTRSKEQYRAFFKPNLETVQPIIQVNKVSYSKATQHYKFDWSNSNQPNHCSLIILSETPIDIQGVHSGKAQDNSTTSTVLGSLHAI